MRLSKEVKHLIIFVSFLSLLCICLTCCSKSQSTDTDKIEFTEEVHKRDGIPNRPFNMRTAATSHAVYHLEEGNTPEEDEALVKKLDKYLVSMERITGISTEKPKEIYILQKIVSGNFYEEKGIFVMTRDDINNDECLCYLIHLLYDCETWLAFGLEGNVTGQTVDLDRLKAYYTSSEDLSMLNMTDLRFYREYTGDEASDLADDTATSFFSYLMAGANIETIPSLFQSNNRIDEKTLTQWKNDWLKSIGVDNIYQNPYGEEFRQFRCETAADGSLLVTFGQFRFHMDTDIYKHGEINDIADLERFFYYASKNTRELKAYLEKELDDKTLNNLHLNDNIDCYIYRMKFSFATPIFSEINLSQVNAFLHEVTHVYCNQENKTSFWASEGLAGYLGFSKFGEFCSTFEDKRNFEQMYNIPDILSVRDSWNNIYQTFSGTSTSSDRYNVEAAFQATAYAYRSGLLSRQDKTLHDAYNTPSSEIYANWTYSECEQFISYLAEKYSIQKVFDLVADSDQFDVIFGKPLEDIYAEWCTYFDAKCAEKLAAN